MKIDLHNHTKHSDGILSLDELAYRAKKNNVDIFALTDHDSVFGTFEVDEVERKYQIKIIKGLELSTLYKNESIHIVCLFKNNIVPKGMIDFSNYIVDARKKRAIEMINKVHDIYNDNGQTILDIPTMPYFDKMPYDLLEEKSFNKYISDLERSVRNSFEYRSLIAYLKTTEGMDVCSFLENVSSRDNTRVKIEIHHSPFTLYDICLAVFKKRQARKESTNIEAVAEEVDFWPLPKKLNIEFVVTL